MVKESKRLLQVTDKGIIMKLKSPEEILEKMLFEDFMKDLRAAKLCASDTLIWVLKDEDSIQRYFRSWLIEKGYATQ